MPDFYYTTRARDLAPDVMQPAHILFCAASNLHKPTAQNPARIQVPRIPGNALSVGADPGGFIVTKKYGGDYPYSVDEYHAWLDAFRPDWAATSDLTCAEREERTVYGKDGRSRTVTEYVSPGEQIVKNHQDFTTYWANEMFQRWMDTPWAWVPTIQGFSIEDYERHAHAMAPIIHKMWSYYQLWGCYHQMRSDLMGIHPMMKRWRAFRIGIGSLVGRDNPGFIREVVLRVQSVIGTFIPIHLWGVKLRYLKAGQQLEGVISYDTSVFDNRFNQEGRNKQKASGRTQTHYRWTVAQREHAAKMEDVITIPPPLRLLPDPAPRKIDIAQVFRDLGQFLTTNQ